MLPSTPPCVFEVNPAVVDCGALPKTRTGYHHSASVTGAALCRRIADPARLLALEQGSRWSFHS